MMHKFLSLTIFVGIVALFPFIIMADWVQMNGPYTGRFIALASDGKDVFAITASAHLYHSGDNGTNWNTGVQIFKYASSNLVSAIAVSKSNLIVNLDRGGSYYSADNGVSWVRADTTNALIKKVTAFAYSGTNLFAGTSDYGVALSTDNGMSFTRINNGIPPGRSDITALVIKGTDIFACSASGFVYHSTDNGWNWVVVDSSFQGRYITAFVANGMNLFASSPAGVFLSSDEGATWTAKNVGLLDSTGTPLTVTSLVLCGASLFAGTNGSGVYCSANNGASWTPFNAGLTNKVINAFVVSGGNIFVGTDGGLFSYANNTAIWKLINTGKIETNVTIYPGFNGNPFALTNDALLRSSENGTNWTVVGNGFSSSNVFGFTILGNNIIIGGHGFFLSTDNTENWIPVKTPFYFQTTGPLSVIGSKIYTGVYYGAGSSGVICSSDSGKSWLPLSWYIPGYKAIIRSIMEIGNNIIVGQGPGSMTSPGVYLSVDTGKSFSLVLNQHANSMAVCRTYAFVGTDSGLYRSTNNGSLWSKILSNIPQNSKITSLSVDKNIIFTGTDNNGIFVSTNNGLNWKSFSLGLPGNTYVNSLSVCGEHLFAGTTGSGVWRRLLSEASVEYPQLILPQNLIVRGPISRNSTLDIIFYLPFSQKVNLMFYNLSGHSFPMLSNKLFGVGTHHLSWNVQKMHSGYYIAKFSTESGVFVKGVPIMR